MNPGMIDFLQYAILCGLGVLGLTVALNLLANHLQKERAARLRQEQVRDWMRSQQ